MLVSKKKGGQKILLTTPFFKKRGLDPPVSTPRGRGKVSDGGIGYDYGRIWGWIKVEREGEWGMVIKKGE